MLDFDAYVERIGLTAADSPTWQAIHRAHATSIPFENLDSHRGMPVSLDQPDLERKMVAEQRGGYCFEHNLLLASALEHLGLRVEPMLARVRIGGAPPEARPTGHLVLRVTDGDGKQCMRTLALAWARCSIRSPSARIPDALHEQSG